MAEGGETPADPAEVQSIAALFARLLDDGANLFRAELNLYRQTAFRRVARAKLPLILAVAAALLAQSAVTTVLIGFSLALARWLGPAGGAVAIGLLALVGSGLMLRYAVGRFMAVATEANVKDKAAVEERVVEERVIGEQSS